MKRQHKEEQYIIPVCVGEKRHHEDYNDSQLGLKKPNLDIQSPLQTSSHGQSKPGMYSIYLILY